jgi:2-C-methyl-D-erythritol 4-phosphate cytidylyltransferase
MKTTAMIVAAGRGLRMGGDVPKQFRRIADKPLLSWTILPFQKAASIDEIMLVVAEDFLLFTNEQVVAPYDFGKLKRIIRGGSTRLESVARCLAAMSSETDFVAIHDGARPLIETADIDLVVNTAHRENAAILGRPLTDTVKRVESEYVIATIDRRRLFRAETPQVFKYDLIRKAYEQIDTETDFTDDAAVLESTGIKVKAVAAAGPNIKITTEADLNLAKLMLMR